MFTLEEKHFYQFVPKYVRSLNNRDDDDKPESKVIYACTDENVYVIFF